MFLRATAAGIALSNTLLLKNRRASGWVVVPPLRTAPANPPPSFFPKRGLSSRILAYLTRKPDRPRIGSVGIVFGLVALIGLTDYVIGTHISLRVFYYIPIALAVAWLGWLDAVMTSVASVGVWLLGDYVAGSTYVRRPAILWNASIVLAMFLVVAWILDKLIALHRELEERVRQRTLALEQEIAARAALQRELLEVGERERSSIGNDLHDGLCQHLVGTALAAQVLFEQMAARGDPAAADARGIVRLVEEGIAQTRNLASGLLLAAITPDRLTAELEELAASVSRRDGLPCRFVLRGNPRVSDAGAASHLFRIAQEAVRNALRHARPRSLEIALIGDGQNVTLTVADDGQGLGPRDGGRGLGLRIMAHRAEILRGDFAVEAVNGGGTRVRCRVPSRSGAG
jgi:signal transduction histidine kinase